jgi:hypothetical protein
MLVLDEADEMLDMGFAEDLDAILNAIPPRASNGTLFGDDAPTNSVHCAEAPQEFHASRGRRSAGVLFCGSTGQTAVSLARVGRIDIGRHRCAREKSRGHVTSTEAMTGRWSDAARVNASLRTQQSSTRTLSLT